MRRVVITGYGVLSSLGTNKEEVRDSLYDARSGIRFQPTYAEQGLRSQIAGTVDINLQERIDRKHFRFMGDAAAYAYIALREAIEDAGLSEEHVSNVRTGLVAGSGGGSTSNEIEGVDTLRAKGIKRVSPFFTPRMMGSTVSANLSTAYKIKGPSYSINSACSTSSHCIGHAMELIQLGKQDIVFAGGAEEEHWCFCMFFDAMRAASTKYNDTPETACRPYDANRDGLVIAGGGAMVVLEELEHAKARGANILAELTGYGATSDGADMVAPSGEGATRCMEMALEGATKTVGYVNTHGTATPVGDIVELRAIKDVFGDDMPYISSTKALSGHSLGATGAQELSYCLLMLQNDFVTKSANIETLDPEAVGYPIALERKDDTGLEAIMSNSFGFGGTNASLIIQKYDE